MGKRCFTCKKKYKKMTSVERKSVKGLNTKFIKPNCTLGEMLKKVGVKIDHREDWDTLICCRKCWSVLKQWSTLNSKANELSERWLKQTGDKLPVFAKVERKTGAFKSQASKYIQCSEYGKAISIIRRSSEAARTAWLKGVTRVVMKEMIHLEKDRELFRAQSSRPKSFDWDHVLAEVESEAPTLYYVLVAALSRKGDLAYGNNRKQALAAPRLGTMLQIGLYHRRPKIHKLSPVHVATSLWGAGSQHKISFLKSVQTLGTRRRMSGSRIKAMKLQAKAREGRLPVPYHAELAKSPDGEWIEENGSATSSRRNKTKRVTKSKPSASIPSFEEIRKTCDEVASQIEQQKRILSDAVSQELATAIMMSSTEAELTTTPEVAMEINISQEGCAEYIDVQEKAEEREDNTVDAGDGRRAKRKRNVVTQHSFEVTLSSIPIPDEREGE